MIYHNILKVIHFGVRRNQSLKIFSHFASERFEHASSHVVITYIFDKLLLKCREDIRPVLTQDIFCKAVDGRG